MRKRASAAVVVGQMGAASGVGELDVRHGALVLHDAVDAVTW